MSWETVIGLEIHAQLATKSKIFSGAATAYGAQPNSQACLVDLGYPGVLPVLNAEAVRMATRFGLAIGAKVARRSVFARKNYFYPDLPKGYQISQYELPIVHDGSLTIMLDDGATKTVCIIRAHLEEDAGKSLHENLAGVTGIDLNRAGTPLIEIVSAPDMSSAKEAVAYMKKIHQLVRWLGICDGNMQEGSFRCDANVSIRRRGDSQLGTRTETKNLNSFRFLERAILFEIDRQTELLEGGGKVVQETRLYDPDRDETRAMRSKEEANDYRYFPDPDLLPVEISDTYIDEVRAALPELPDAKRARLIAEHGLGDADATQLVETRELAERFEAIIAALPAEVRGPKANRQVANWLTGDLTALLNRDGVTLAESDRRLTVRTSAALLARIADDTISRATGKDLLERMWITTSPRAGDVDVDQLIDASGLRQITDTGAIEKIVDEVLAANGAQVAQYKAGQTKVMGFLVGQVMKASAGKANPAQVNELLKKKLDG
jgi:aspartyl-tRNA(Asn)/glutamyl-tRNA(Gln) amidotransferase subunit B